MGHARARAELSLVGVTCLWGATFVVVKDAIEDVSTLLFLAMRFTVASCALAVFYRGRLSAAFARPSGAAWGGVLAGLCLMAGYLLQTTGLRYTTASKSAFLTGLTTALVPILGSFVYRRVPRLAEAAGVAVALGGMALLTLPPGAWRIGWGDLLTIGCAVGFAAHILVVGHFTSKGGFELLCVLQIATVAALSAGTFWWAETPRIRWNAGLAGAVVLTGLLATALAFTVQAWAQRHTTPTRTALIFAIEPVAAAVASYVALGEHMTRRGVLGGALILAGVLVVELKPGGRASHPE